MAGTGGAGRRWLAVLHSIEDAILALILGVMIVIATAQIILRNTIHWNLGWGDPLVRLLVLWVGLLGALAASRNNRHISIDILSHLFPPTARRVAQAANCLFTSFVCAVVAWYAIGFISDERNHPGIGLLGLPEWILHSIVPLGFTLIALRYLLMAFTGVAAVEKQA
nr:ectoine TRAP transporter small permease protein TeaB [uncultured bacterium]